MVVVLNDSCGAAVATTVTVTVMVMAIAGVTVMVVASSVGSDDGCDILPESNKLGNISKLHPFHSGADW